MSPYHKSLGFIRFYSAPGLTQVNLATTSSNIYCRVCGGVSEGESSPDLYENWIIAVCEDCKVIPRTPCPIVKEWVSKLDLRFQGTLLTAIRGCDVQPKFPLESSARELVAAIRFAIMVPYDYREVDSTPGCFMVNNPPVFKPSEFGHLPEHWYSHVMHAVEVIGYMHPVPTIAHRYLEIYNQFCESLHVTPETKEIMINRLTEDRIAKGEIAS